LAAAWKKTLHITCPHCGEVHKVSVRDAYIQFAVQDGADPIVIGYGASTSYGVFPAQAKSGPSECSQKRLGPGLAHSVMASYPQGDALRRAMRMA
jgi:hypothetical protein